MSDARARRSSGDRLLDILGVFTPGRSALTLTEIAGHTGLPLTTAHRLVATLARWGALERGDDGVYHVGLRLWEVASLAPRGVGLREAAMPFLEDLYEATHENVQLAVRDGMDAVYVERIFGRSAVGVHTRVGARWPLHATGVGLVLLAYGPAELQEAYCARPLERFTRFTVTDPGELRRVLAQVRLENCAVSSRQITEDAVSVAAPVRDTKGAVTAAVSLVVPAAGTDPRRLIAAVRFAGLGIGRALGGDAGGGPDDA
ncbi:IclR family transcriptional regulator [Yinghuangia sp. KLBMP8922]|uniref:IclR family transcriptional regulator n=1 Tax=Yinghuangia soli TaxID=2908204 RepID=A0AA41Q863_9ACTN|nr:IclR family transcriptional regulator [Yinghuangia soli]MCF2532491.1 IclR family transcriptional regulator [Yinghuangia soli]